jgi:hypothetical protein
MARQRALKQILEEDIRSFLVVYLISASKKRRIDLTESGLALTFSRYFLSSIS